MDNTRLTLVFAALVVVAVQIVAVASGAAPVLDGRLMDPDGYMKLIRVEELIQHGDWYQSITMRTDAPYGETLHWTRGFDLLVLLPALALKPFLGLHQAVWWSGVISCPLLFLALLPVLRWSTRGLLGDGGFLVALLAIVLAPQINSHFVAGMADHHALVSLLFLVQLGAALRLVRGLDGDRTAIIAGLAGALGLWNSVEAVFTQAWFFGTIGLFWLIRRDPSARILALAALALALGTTVELAVERPPADWLVLANPRLSAAHLLLTWGLAAGAGLIALGDRRLGAHPAGRVALGLAGGLVPALLMAVVYPKFFAGPWPDATPELTAWQNTIAEYQSLLPTDRASLSSFFAHMGTVLVALPFIVLRLRSGPPDQRRAMAVLGLVVLGYLPLAFDKMRWVSYLQLAAAVPWAMTLAALIRWRATARIAGHLVPLRTLPVMAAIAAPLLLAWLTAPPGAPLGEHGKTATAEACPWTALDRWLAGAPLGLPAGAIIFADVYQGPELVWRTQYRVVGAPFDNPRSVGDTAHLWGATDEATARAIVDRRGIALLVTCQEPGKAPPFETRLRTGDAPAWLKAVALPAPLAGFKVWRVVAER